ncbi:hypothetical protein PCASD_04606 [Puccinia coronata f. sp. avenae]|uniref:DASH complex subunit DUO1 n=1 Tax=Puccinia coronata f. sp. avenae TaxID=200324 RepID=A0A2N5V525_9BASI|nr:hypothetical protein PCASD_04606 [Puccinia coronata f. sp. avenae]
MSSHPKKQAGASARWTYDADILNDSIWMNMEDDSFDGNEITLILPANPAAAAAGPSSSSGKTSTRSAVANVNEPGPSSSKTRHQFSSSPAHDEPAVEEDVDDRQAGKSSTEQWIRRETERNQELENERDWLRDINRLLKKSADEMDTIKDNLTNSELERPIRNRNLPRVVGPLFQNSDPD